MLHEKMLKNDSSDLILRDKNIRSFGKNKSKIINLGVIFNVFLIKYLYKMGGFKHNFGKALI